MIDTTKRPNPLIGRITAVESGIATQSLGRSSYHDHVVTELERVVFVGEMLMITYRVSELARVEVVGEPDPDCLEYDIALELWERSRKGKGLQR